MAAMVAAFNYLRTYLRYGVESGREEGGGRDEKWAEENGASTHNNVSLSPWQCPRRGARLGLPPSPSIAKRYIALLPPSLPPFLPCFSITSFPHHSITHSLRALPSPQVLGAPMRYFDTTPLGSLVQRFSSDLDQGQNHLASRLPSFPLSPSPSPSSLGGARLPSLGVCLPLSSSLSMRRLAVRTHRSYFTPSLSLSSRGPSLSGPATPGYPRDVHHLCLSARGHAGRHPCCHATILRSPLSNLLGTALRPPLSTSLLRFSHFYVAQHRLGDLMNLTRACFLLFPSLIPP